MQIFPLILLMLLRVPTCVLLYLRSTYAKVLWKVQNTDITLKNICIVLKIVLEIIWNPINTFKPNDLHIYIYIYVVNSIIFQTFFLLWTPTHGRAKVGRPARTYVQQLCEDTGCCPEDLPEAMNDREKWRKRVRDICATSKTWWWWWWLLYIWWDDWLIFMISGANEQLHQELEYTLLKPDCHSWWISKMQYGREDSLEEGYAIFFFN